MLSDGHRVRLATHKCFRTYVESQGLEFYPLAGDPHLLSDFMVKTHGCIIPTTTDLLRELPQNLTMLTDIINSCWGACVLPDPGPDPGPEPGSIPEFDCRHVPLPFTADAIISNPVTYGHIHCAEALGVPLHLMFPQVRTLYVRTSIHVTPLHISTCLNTFLMTHLIVYRLTIFCLSFDFLHVGSWCCANVQNVLNRCD